MTTYLVDLDGVVTDTMAGFNQRWKEMFPGIRPVPREKISTFYIEDSYPEMHRKKVNQVWRSKGLFRNLKPIPGALLALEELNSISDVCICSSPFTENPDGAQDKWDWVNINLGKAWTKRLVLTSDKTRVIGDYLIDDKPEISGKVSPTWEHVIYSQPWNSHITGKKRLTWDNYKAVLGII
jgi:5'-nucleotidase